MPLQRIMRIIAIVITMLIIPFIGMHLSDDVVWSSVDFVVAAIILFGAGIIYEVLRLFIINPRRRILIGMSITVLVFIGWVELAVGVFGTPFAGS